jgi:hypothetical protein
MAKLASHDQNAITNLNPKLTIGEEILLNFFQEHHDEDWEIYLQPHLNGLRPDFVLLNSKKGVIVVEVKDWKLSTLQVKLEKKDFRWLNKYDLYHREIPKLYGFRTGSSLGSIELCSYLFFSKINQESLKKSLGYKFSGYSDRHLVGADNFNKLMIKSLEISPSSLLESEELEMHSNHTQDLRNWLVEPNYSKLQREPIPFDWRQREIINKKVKRRSIQGSAGSGKSSMLVARANQLAHAGKSVLFLCYNKTILTHLKDISARVEYSCAHKITWLYFHAWQERLFREFDYGDAYKSIWANSGNNPNLALNELTRFLKKELPQIKDDADLYDAVILDEAQDFLPEWIELAQKFVREEGEMILAVDPTQDIYETGVTWQERTKIDIFTGFRSPITLKATYRLPENLRQLCANFAKYFIDTNSTIFPEKASTRDFFDCKINWVNCQESDLRTTFWQEIDQLFEEDQESQKGGFAVSDICVIAGSITSGSLIEHELTKKNIKCISTFSDNKLAEGYKRTHNENMKKMYFFKNDARVKITTIHSFKGFEATRLLILVNPKTSGQLLYTALTRIIGTERGSSVTVINSDAKYNNFGANFTSSRAK